MRERLKQVMGSVFELDPAEIPDDASGTNVPGWDSLRHLELLLALEAEFGIHIASQEMLELVSLPVIEDFLERRLVQ